jgi:hypothetical protein
MPNLTATAHQAIRYFFVGAIAVALVLFLGRGPSTATWLKDAEEVVTSLGSPGAVVGMWIIGTVIYGLHRILIYPVLYRLVVLSVFWAERRRRWFWPFGTATEPELRLENKMAGAAERTHSRFVGWASEVHLYYVTLEIALFTVCWPGWQFAGGCWWWTGRTAVFGLLILMSLVWGWDRYLLVLERSVRPRQ